MRWAVATADDKWFPESPRIGLIRKETKSDRFMRNQINKS